MLPPIVDVAIIGGLLLLSGELALCAGAHRAIRVVADNAQDIALWAAPVDTVKRMRLVFAIHACVRILSEWCFITFVFVFMCHYWAWSGWVFGGSVWSILAVNAWMKNPHDRLTVSTRIAVDAMCIAASMAAGGAWGVWVWLVITHTAVIVRRVRTAVVPTLTPNLTATPTPMSSPPVEPEHRPEVPRAPTPVPASVSELEQDRASEPCSETDASGESSSECSSADFTVETSDDDR